MSKARDLANIAAGSGDLNIDSNTLFVDASENKVGIGTTSPASALEVSNGVITAGGTSNVLIGRYSSTFPSTGDGYFRIRTNNSNEYDGGISFETLASGVLSEAMRITSSGNVGIGTTSPGSILEIVEPDNTAAIVNLYGARTTNGNNAFFTGWSSRGSVASPASLNANDVIATFSANGHDGSNYLGGGRVRFAVDSISTGSLNSRIEFLVNDGTGDGEAMRLDSSGRLGIGTSSPSYQLHVVDGADSNVARIDGSSSRLYLQSNSTSFDIVSETSAAAPQALKLRVSGGGGLTIDSSANVGIGTTSPSGKLHVSWASGSPQLILERTGTATGKYYISTSSNALQFYDYASASERMRIDSSGDLLVGKTTTAFGTAGVRAISNGQLQATANNNEPLDLNRTGNDGEIINFYKDSGIVGAIGVNSGDIPYFASSDNTGLKFDGDNGRIEPCNADGTGSDADIDLGSTTNRFKELYLSNMVHIDNYKLETDYLYNQGGNFALTHWQGYLGATGDPSAAYILLCVAYSSSLKSKSWCHGTVLRSRGSTGAQDTTSVYQVVAASGYNTNRGDGIYYGSVSGEMRLCTYNSTRYIALFITSTSRTSLTGNFWYGGSGAFAPFMVDDSAVSSVSTLSTLDT